MGTKRRNTTRAARTSKRGATAVDAATASATPKPPLEPGPQVLVFGAAACLLETVGALGARLDGR